MIREIPTKDRPIVGIAFGGGAARGFAHIGILEALFAAGDERLMPHLVAGTSTGGIMGALYASGLSVQAIKEEAAKIGWLGEVIDVSKSITDGLRDLPGLFLPGKIENWLRENVGLELDQNRGGLLNSRGLENWINRLISPDKTFDDLEKKLAVVATEIEKKERVILTSSDLRQKIDDYIATHSKRHVRSRIVDTCPSVARAVRASSAIPWLFEIVTESGLRLVDGGIIDQVPVEIAKAMGADIVIGVSLGTVQFFERPSMPHQSLMNSLEVMSREMIESSLAIADIGIEIPGIEKASLIDMGQREALIGLGRDAMNGRLDELMAKVEQFGETFG
jgi:NTE family protein